MKKIQKLALALVATSSLLSVSAFAADNQFYITAGGGALFSDKQLSNFENSYTNSEGDEVTNKFTFKKAKTSYEMFAGVGYYVMDKVRTELVFVKPWFNKQNITQANTNAGDQKNYSGKLDSQINAAQIKGYYDAFDIAEIGKAYVGVGIGWSQVQAKLTTNDSDVGNVKTKKKNNLAWNLAVGAVFDVVEEVKVGLEYNYQDFGRVKNPLKAPKDSADQKNNTGNINFHGHAVVAKLMFNI